MAELLTRFWSKVDRHGPRTGRLGRCWIWTGATNPDGYGYLKIGSRVDGSRRNERAHRIAWIFHTGLPIPKRKRVLHHCDNPPCVRFSHLWLGTQLDNIRDRDAKGRSARDEAGRYALAG